MTYFKTLFLLFITNFLSAQINYKNLSIELIKQIEVNNFTKKFPIDPILVKINEMPDSLQKEYFQKNAKLFLFEIAYGHKPKYLQHQSLEENIDNELVNNSLNLIENGKSISEIIEKIEPNIPIFKKLKPISQIDSLPQLAENLNFYRYLNRFSLDKYIVLNIPSAYLTLYHDHKNILEMRAIVGRQQNETPRLASYIESITVYPYWVPTRSIATKELLPLIKRNIKYLESGGFDVLDLKGNLVNPYEINWKALSEKNFPYKLRQSTGCDNSLGLLKFNLVNPFSVYLHDTKHQKAAQDLFEKENRFFSHGCMRLSKPMELANLIADKSMFDEEFMDICLKEAKSQVIPMKDKIPVFVIYQTQQLDESGQFHQYKNPYRLKVQ